MLPTITIQGAWAELTNAPVSVLEETLTALDGNRFHIQAFRDKRWDGKVRLYSGQVFPAGLAKKVSDYLNERGQDVQILCDAEAETIDTARFTNQYLPGITLWPHQMEAVLTMLREPCGSIKSPTGSGKGEMITAAARYFWEELGWRSLVVVPKKGLAVQQYHRMKKYYGSDIQVGLYGDGYKLLGPIVVSTAQSLVGFKSRVMKVRGKGLCHVPADKDLKNIVQNYEVLFLDETHHASSISWFDLSMASGAKRRFGLSGTLLKSDELCDMRMVGATGPLIFSSDATEMINLDLCAEPRIVFVMSDNASFIDRKMDDGEIRREPLPVKWLVRNGRDGKEIRVKRQMSYDAAYVRGIVENVNHNNAVIRATKWLVDQKKQTLVLCRRKEHFVILKDMLEKSGISCLFVWGGTKTLEREMAKKALGSRRVQCILASTIWDEGEDVPGIEALVLAEGVKADTNVLQRIGRGMRKKKTGDNVVWVVDFAPTCYPKFLEHAITRAELYEREGFDVRILTDWPLDKDFDETYLLPFNEWEPRNEK